MDNRIGGRLNVMLKNDPDYRHLKVANRGSFSAASYWIGPEHVLIVETTGYSERYRRIAFSDIQSIIVRGTASRDWTTRIFGMLAVVFALILTLVFLNSTDPFSRNAFVFITGLGSVFCISALVVNIRRGPTCVVNVQTAVQTLPLPCVTRERNAEKLIQELTPLVLAAQTGAGQSASNEEPAPTP